MKLLSPKGFTWFEVLVAIVVVGVLLIVAWMILPPPTGSRKLARARATQVLSNMKTLHLATQQMNLDSQTNGNPIRWTCSGTRPLSFDQWHKALVPDYLHEQDFQKLISIRGEKGIIEAMNVFAICDSDVPGTVLFATKNWHGINVHLSGEPFGDGCFVIFHKAGDGAVLQERDATNTNAIGSGGLHHFLPLK